MIQHNWTITVDLLGLALNNRYLGITIQVFNGSFSRKFCCCEPQCNTVTQAMLPQCIKEKYTFFADVWFNENLARYLGFFIFCSQ